MKSTDCVACVKERTRARRATPKGRSERTTWSRNYVKRRKQRDPEYAAKRKQIERRWEKRNDGFRARKSERDRSRKQQMRGAQQAALTLTAVLGVEHVVAVTIDPATGRKSFQPLPEPANLRIYVDSPAERGTVQP